MAAGAGPGRDIRAGDTPRHTSRHQGNRRRHFRFDKRVLDLHGVSLTGAILDGAKLTAYGSPKVDRPEDGIEAYFDGADFSNATLKKADFRGASLQGADLTARDLTGAKFEGAILDNAKWPEDKARPPRGWLCESGLLKSAEAARDSGVGPEARTSGLFGRRR